MALCASGLSSTTADVLAFTPLYVDFHAPGLNISSRIGLKLKPSGSSHVFNAVEELFQAFMTSLQEALICFERDEVLQEFISLKERAIRSLDEWQEFVEDWKSTLIRRMTELHSDLSTANARISAAQASEKEVNQLLKEKDATIKELLQAQLRMARSGTEPQLDGESQQPSDPDSPATVGTRLSPFSPVLPSVKDSNPGRPRRFSFSNAVSSVTANIRRRRHSDVAIALRDLPQRVATPIQGVTLQATPQDASTQTDGVEQVQPYTSSSTSKQEAHLHNLEAICPGCGAQNDADDSFCRKCGRRQEAADSDGASDEQGRWHMPLASIEGSSDGDDVSESELQSVPGEIFKPPGVDAATQVDPVARSNRGVQCALQAPGARLPKIGFANFTEYSDVKRRGAGSVILPNAWKSSPFA
mmetsp:Transcript_489/g.413  ORF Transcript_489/g.413 Transcript_489/m.413 type:complete len:415 (+) Transcript_489:44-1288(+)